MKQEDREIIQRAAVAEGVANTRQAAIARAVLEHEAALERPAGEAPADLEELLAQAATKALAPIIERVDALEATMKALELPDMPALEETIGGLSGRLKALEVALGEGTSDAPASGASKPARRRG